MHHHLHQKYFHTTTCNRIRKKPKHHSSIIHFFSYCTKLAIDMKVILCTTHYYVSTYCKYMINPNIYDKH